MNIRGTDSGSPFCYFPSVVDKGFSFCLQSSRVTSVEDGMCALEKARLSKVALLVCL